MTRGTPSMGKRHKVIHIKCRRCGRRSYHVQDKVCAACGFGTTARFNRYNWKVKTVQRKRLR